MNHSVGDAAQLKHEDEMETEAPEDKDDDEKMYDLFVEALTEDDHTQ